MKTAEDRTREWNQRKNNVQNVPVSYCDSNKRPLCIIPFDGEWLHSTNIKNKITMNGWKPDLVKNTIYGAAIYLSREKWDDSHKDVICCCFKLDETETMTVFASENGAGSTHDNLLWYLNESGITCGRNTDNGLASQNQKIKQHFLQKGVKAIQFTEHERIVVAVYDPSCIYVIANDSQYGENR